ncbi:hypothetical protein C4D60_Mb09t13270 [Musa balbisiana]|uniref:AD domain-containing protein n=1 Tax=Musa balbisiana TaxID=52838 RepID=A0A4S8IG57_MUSBA|nr:hypothetical protein C4D60_Mb09t13270 [Musa balbisiana]
MEGGNGEELAVGCVLSLRTTLGDEIEGQIIAYDRPSNILVIHILLALVNPMYFLFLSDVSLFSIRFFDRSSTQEGSSKAGPRRNIRLLKANYIQDFTYLRKAEDPIDPNKCYIDLAGLQAREEASLRLPVHWDKTVIVVMNEVRVSSPYHPENVTGGTPAANDRVKKVLDFERKRLQVRGPG